MKFRHLCKQLETGMISLIFVAYLLYSLNVDGRSLKIYNDDAL